MELVTPECFNGLSEEEKQAQLYLAFYTWADDTDLLDPECFLGYPHRDEAIYAALHIQGGTVDPSCIESLPPEDRQLAMYEAVYSAAADDTLTDPTCFLSLSPEVRDLAFYTALYVIADDVDLVSPECFLGSSREEQRKALYTAAYQIAQEPVDPIIGMAPLIWLRRDSILVPVDDPVSEWPDVSGNGNDFAQPNATKQPFMTEGGPEFDGVDDYIRSEAMALNSVTVFASVTPYAYGFFPQIVNLTFDRELRLHADNGRPQFVSNGIDSLIATNPLVLGERTVVAFSQNSSTGETGLWIDGALAISGVLPFVSPNDLVRVGARNEGELSFPGIIGEVVIFDRVLSSDEVAAASQSIASR